MRKKSINRMMAVCAAAFLFAMTGCGASKEEKQQLSSAFKQLEQAQYEEALEKFEKLKKAEDLKMDVYRGIGIAQFELRDYDAAVKALKTALSSSDGYVGEKEIDIAMYLADAYGKNQMADKALEVYDDIIGVDKDYEAAYLKKGELLLDSQNTEDAVKTFDKLINLHKKEASMYIRIYELMEEKGFGEEGKKYLEDGQIYCGSDADGKYMLGQISYYQGNEQDALKYLDQAAKDGKDDAYTFLGRIYEEAGEYDTAASFYSKYLDKHADSDSTYSKLSVCMLKQEKYEVALDYIQKGLTNGSGEAKQELLYHEAVVYEYLLDFTTAKQKFEEYMALYPSDEQAAKELDFLMTQAGTAQEEQPSESENVQEGE